MIDYEKLQEILTGYKSYLPEHWKDEKYKWEAVQHFQNNWNIEAPDFGEMFKCATEKTKNLLASGYAYPKAMILEFAKADDEATRQMFRNLFDDNKDLAERVNDFKASAEEIRAKYDGGTWHKHYQDNNAISTYLWLKYPEKYYIYKYDLYHNMASQLCQEYCPKRNGSVDNLIKGYQFYDEVSKVLSEDTDIINFFKQSLTDNCYPDTNMKTATIDVGYYLSEFYLKENINNTDISLNSNGAIWKISEGTDKTGVSTSNKIIFLERQVVVVHSNTKAKATSKTSQGHAFTSKIKKGDYFYLCYGNSIQLLGQFISENAVENPEMKDGWYERKYRIIADSKDKSAYDGEKKWWTPNDSSTCIQIDEKDYSQFEKLILKPYFGMLVKELLCGTDNNKRYWWLNANPKIWSYSDIKIGEEQFYTLYNENGNKRRIFQNFLDVKAGDVVIGYEATPVKKIVALCEITRENDGKNIYFQKNENLSSPITYSFLKNCEELQNMEFLKQSNGSLFKLTENEYDFIMDVIREENPKVSTTPAIKYSKEDFLNTVYITEERYNALEALLRNKKNIILQGAPGVGKTFAAKRLAYAMMGEIDESRIEFIQFHQNYSYEDFIMGYRPDGEGFKLTEGIFYRFCQKAANNPDKEHFFIIDEINRGNMSKIFGELMMLIEKDYRGTKATLAYSGMPFSVPENLYIIGMMNTADRSLAMIDYALRRRFSFFEMEPGFNSEGFSKYRKSFENETFDALIEMIKILNKDISDDKSLGRGFRIGHSYFCGCDKDDCTTDWMRAVVEFDILPMLEEYWFDEPSKLQQWKNNLRGVFDD